MVSLYLFELSIVSLYLIQVSLYLIHHRDPWCAGVFTAEIRTGQSLVHAESQCTCRCWYFPGTARPFDQQHRYAA